LITAICLSLSSCFEETFESDLPVEFGTSLDTLTFDTVFTEVGSATRSFVVRNPTSQNIVISSIGLEREAESMFRINVDGIPGRRVDDIPILADDSLFVFVEVTVDFRPEMQLGKSYRSHALMAISCGMTPDLM